MNLTQVSIDIPSLPLIDREALPHLLPASMEARLFNEKGLEPALILFHPKAECYVFVRLTDLNNLPTYIDEVNVAVLKQAMGEPPEEDGYRIDR